MMKCVKYQSLGNDYLIADIREQAVHLSPHQVAMYCHRQKGLGADGILVGPRKLQEKHFGLDIYNADGTLAEISGNGTLIFATHLARTQTVAFGETFYLQPSPHCCVQCCCTMDAVGIKGELRLGRGQCAPALFWPVPIPLQHIFHLPETLKLFPVNMGNPHCVVPVSTPTRALACALGPILEQHPYFPEKTNVQFVSWFKTSPQISMEVWERGSGYTLGSGSSSCAVVCAYRQNFSQTETSDITVHMPGGTLQVHATQDPLFSFNGHASLVYSGEVTLEE